VDSDEFLDLVNDSTRELMNRGNFWGTVKRATFCAYNNCIVYPRYVGTVLALNRCGRSIPPKNYWYGFDDVLPDDVRAWNSFGPGLGWGNLGWGNGALAAADMTNTSVFNQIPCLNDRYLEFYPTAQADVGKKITIFGIDGYGQTIRTARADGTILDGVELTLAIPFVRTPMLVRFVERVLKDPTVRQIVGYQFDGQNRFNLAQYAASETNPTYRTQQVVTGCSHVNTNCGCGPFQYKALIKLEFIPAETEEDLVLIDNVDALALAVQSIKTSDSYGSGDSETLMLRAVHEMNLQLQNKLPLSFPTSAT
jgi:hypothetical protein